MNPKPERRPLLRAVTVATQEEDPSGKGGHLRILEASCREQGMPLEVLGLGREWEGFGMKLSLVGEYLEGLPDETLVLFLDAYDVVVLEGVRGIQDRFLAFGCPIVFSAETCCWPRAELAPLYPEPLPPRGTGMDPRIGSLAPPPPLRSTPRYLNSGGYMGCVGAVRRAIRELSPHPGDDDQELFSLYFLEHQEIVRLDYDGTLFQTLSGISADDFQWDPDGSRALRNRWTGSRPCVLHGNGWGMFTFLEILRRLGLD